MRQMPHSWLAFEGYDTIHKCPDPIKKDYKQSENYTNSKITSRLEGLIKIEIPTINIGENYPPVSGVRQNNNHLETLTISSTKPITKPIEIKNHINSTVFPSKTNNTDNLFRNIYIIILVLIFVIIVIRSIIMNSSSHINLNSNSSAPNISNLSSPTKILIKTSTLSPTTSIPTQTRNVIMGCVEAVSSINVRKCPGIKYESFRYLYKGDCVEFIGIDKYGIWAAISSGGWVNTTNLDVRGDLGKLPVVDCE